MRQGLLYTLRDAQELPPEELPKLLGEIEEIRMTAMARLTTHASVQAHSDQRVDMEGAVSHSRRREDRLCQDVSAANGNRSVQREYVTVAKKDRIHRDVPTQEANRSAHRDVLTETTNESIKQEYVSVKEAHKITSRSAWTWRKDAREGRIASVKLGTKLLIPRSEIDRVMREGLRPALPDPIPSGVD